MEVYDRQLTLHAAILGQLCLQLLHGEGAKGLEANNCRVVGLTLGTLLGQIVIVFATAYDDLAHLFRLHRRITCVIKLHVIGKARKPQ